MRKKKVIKRHLIKPDLKYNSEVVNRLINKVMKDGEKRCAKRIVYRAAQLVEEKIPSSFLTILTEALVNVSPEWELKSWKVGGASYRVPAKVEERRSASLALRWLVENARQRTNATSFFQHLADEIIDSYNKTGGTFQKKETILKEAKKNMAFASLLKK